MTDTTRHEDHRSDREILIDIDRKQNRLMTTVTEVTEQLTTLTADLEADSTAALAEFAKLEKEVEEGKATPESLEPLKTLIEGLDAKVKAAASAIPTE